MKYITLHGHYIFYVSIVGTLTKLPFFVMCVHFTRKNVCVHKVRNIKHKLEKKSRLSLFETVDLMSNYDNMLRVVQWIRPSAENVPVHFH